MPFRLTDTEWVLIVLAGIYLFESACWVRREAMCLGTVLGRFRNLPSPAFLGNAARKLVLGNPSPGAQTFVCEPWPLSFSPRGICLPERATSSPCWISFGDMQSIAVSEKELQINGQTIARCASTEHAEDLAAVLREVAAASEGDRPQIIGKQLDRWTDNVAAAARFEELKKLDGVLRASAFMLFLLVFVLGPVLYYAPWKLPWHVVAVYFTILFATWMLTVWDYSVSRKKLLGERFAQRFRHTAMLLLSPASAMRSPETLFRNGLAAYHPLAAAAALCTKNRCAALARPLLLGLEFPIPGEVPDDPAASQIEAWFRKKLLKRLHSFMRRVEIDPGELLCPAEPVNNSRTYCPRCHNQFLLAEGTCPDCRGLPLVAYAEHSPTERSCDKIEQ